MDFDCLIVGAGFAGAVLAERLASQLQQKVLLVDRRDHLGGNAYDFPSQEGLMVQKYGPHIFHTNSQRVWEYLSSFADWNSYAHRVLASVNGKMVSLPISVVTLEQLNEEPFDPEKMAIFFAERRTPCERIKNSRDVIVSQVGEDIYNLFFRNYTKKQWGVYPEDLDPEVTKRLPVRFDRDTRYFADQYQGLPIGGFTRVFENMLDHPNISIRLNTDFLDLRESVSFKYLIYTGEIDRFFDYRYGKLPYRSLDFEFEVLEADAFQPAGVVNYPNDFEFTRITEFKKLYQQEGKKTIICREYPRDAGEPYYPVPRKEAQDLYRKYQEEAERLENVYFVGRLAQYRYMNMDQVVDSALGLYEELKARYGTACRERRTNAG